MIVTDILNHFLTHSTWVDPQKTVDRVIAGDPDKDVDRCLVTWMPNMKALGYAVENGYELIICHEPTFWNHFDDIPAASPRTTEKAAFIQENNLTILRNHDCWDRWPDVGIPWAWAYFLGIEGQPVKFGQDGYQQRYDILVITLGDFASQIAGMCATIGESQVQVTGDLNQPISKIGIGTGCACDIETFIQMDCDCSIVCDDGSTYWSNIQMAEDIGHPVIRVNHGTSEEPGMITLTQYINDNLGIQAEHFPHGATFRLVSSNNFPND
ncbi:Nif3-like dinuclear metal center hexameric protein [Chloroflexota bacterium]